MCDCLSAPTLQEEELSPERIATTAKVLFENFQTQVDLHQSSFNTEFAYEIAEYLHLAIAKKRGSSVRKPLCGDCKGRLTHDNRCVGDDLPAHVYEAIETANWRLDWPTRRRFERLLDFNFGDVRLSIGDAADESTQALQLPAYTVGNRIVFDKSQFQPGMPDSDWLLVHELIHVMQQSQSHTVSSFNRHYLQALEQQAVNMAEMIVSQETDRLAIVNTVRNRLMPAPYVIQAAPPNMAAVNVCRWCCRGILAIPDPDTGNPAGCGFVGCGKPWMNPPPWGGISCYCMFACSKQGAVIFTWTSGAQCGPVYSIV